MPDEEFIASKKRKVKAGPIIALGVIVLALAFGVATFKSSLAAYVPFSQAVSAAQSGATVQIMGVPVKGDTRFDTVSGTLIFALREPTSGALMPVAFKSPKPDNFDEAVRITAIGHYDPSQKTFEADNLLVKCPSKYAGDPQAAQDRSYGSQS
jgi:cytochrome c-type biogenesis protein CcmE